MTSTESRLARFCNSGASFEVLAEATATRVNTRAMRWVLVLIGVSFFFCTPSICNSQPKVTERGSH